MKKLTLDQFVAEEKERGLSMDDAIEDLFVLSVLQRAERMNSKVADNPRSDLKEAIAEDIHRKHRFSGSAPFALRGSLRGYGTKKRRS